MAACPGPALPVVTASLMAEGVRAADGGAVPLEQHGDVPTMA